MLRDIGQSFYRVRYSKHVAASGHVAMTICPDQLVWIDVSHPRRLLGLEALILQGFPTTKVPNTVSSTPDMWLQDLAGNAMASTVLLAIFVSLFESAVWRNPSASDLDMGCVDVAQAMQIFEISASSLRSVDYESNHEDGHKSSSALVSKRRKKT